MTLLNNDLDARIEKSAELLLNARYAIAFTGAGISTPSGIPDFRSPMFGLWNHYDPFQVASLHAFRHHPEKFFNWIQPLAKQSEAAKPNQAHIGLAEMGHVGIIKTVITQNIDGLHQKAGSQQVLELHGSAKTATCLHCGRKYQTDEYKKPLLTNGDIPRCENCGEIIKPDVILFGEMLPQEIWDQAYAACLETDLMLVAGSSLEVSPANSLPELALTQGAKLIINNLSQTHLDRHASILLPIDVEEGIGKLWQQIRASLD